MSISLLLVDQSQEFLNDLSSLLSKNPQYDIKRTFTQATTTITYLRQEKIDVVVVGEELQDKSGYELILETLQILAIPFLIIRKASGSPNRERFIKATKYGIVEEVFLDFEDKLMTIPSSFDIKVNILSKLKLHRFTNQINQLNKMSPYSKSDLKPEIGIDVITETHEQRIERIKEITILKHKLRKEGKLEIPSGRRMNHVIIIGASTGGPRSLIYLISQITRDFPPIVIVQHMPEFFVENFAKRMNKNTEVTVKVGDTGDLLRPGHVYVAPGGYHLEFASIEGKVRILITDGPKINYVKPAVDVTLFSAVEHFGGRIVSVILTGMGSDGTEGSRLVKKYGGKVIALNEIDSVIFGMNKSVIENNLADDVCGIDEIVPSLARVLRTI